MSSMHFQKYRCGHKTNDVRYILSRSGYALASTPPGMPGTHPPIFLVGGTSTGISPQYYYVLSGGRTDTHTHTHTDTHTHTVVKLRGARGGSAPPASTLAEFGPPLLESELSLPIAGPKLLNSIKNNNVRCRINKF